MPLNSYPLDKPLKKSIIMNSFTIRVLTLELFNFIELEVTIYDLNDSPCDKQFYRLEGKLYKEWMDSDDNWILNYIKQKLSLIYENYILPIEPKVICDEHCESCQI